MEEIFVGYFNNLFASSNPSAIDEVIHLVDTAVTPSMNLNLLMPFFFFFFFFFPEVLAYSRWGCF
jgi:hypothetical protein